MTPYEQGFMDKCAELGVDPAALVKRAGILRLLSVDLRPIAAAARRGSSRFGELLLGGSKSLRANHVKATNALESAFDSARGLYRKAHTTDGQLRADVARLAQSAADNTKPLGSDATNPLLRVVGKIRQGHEGDPTGWLEDALRGSWNGADRILNTELRKVLAARLGLAGVGGAGYGAYKAVSGKKDK